MKKLNLVLIIVILLSPFLMKSQGVLELQSCESAVYEINDNSDSDDDGVICEAKITLTNTAFYTEEEECELSDIHWDVFVDIDADGIDDLEYSSTLPSDDTTLDDTNGNGIPDLYITSTLSNEIQSINLQDIEGPMSNHKVRWLVSDACGMENLCETNFSVEDRKAPTPFCVSLSTIIYQGVDKVIQAKNYNIGVFDNCTDNEDIRISFSDTEYAPTWTINCDNAVDSLFLVPVYFWDESDNIEVCYVNVDMKIAPWLESLLDCDNGGEIKGVVTDTQGNPMEGVEVCLDANSLVEYPRCIITDEEGKYSFGNHAGGIEFQLTANYDNNYLNGVSTLDFVKIQRHILGLEPLPSPYKIISSDVNGNGRVIVYDLVVLRRLILGIITKIPNNKSWNFIDASFEFLNPSNPFQTLNGYDEVPFIFKFNSINEEGYNFIGMKTGDVTNF